MTQEVRDTTARIRETIRGAIAVGELPGTWRNYSVRIVRSLTAGDSILVTAHDLPGVAQPCSAPEHKGYWEASQLGGHIRDTLVRICRPHKVETLVRIVDEQADRHNAESLAAWEAYQSQERRRLAEQAQAEAFDRVIARVERDGLGTCEDPQAPQPRLRWRPLPYLCLATNFLGSPDSTAELGHRVA